MQESLRGSVGGADVSKPNITEAQAAAAVTADDWTVATGSYNGIVYDSGDTTWDALLVDDEFDRNTVYYNRSGPLAAPYGGGNAGDQFS
jgi:hypothetical protein